MVNFPKNLQKKLDKRHKENAFRRLGPASGLVDFSSNDYLGLSKEKAISEMALELMISQEGHRNGATGSRLLSGNHSLYDPLEDFLSEFYNSKGALIFNSGYDANLGFFSTVSQRGDVVLFDEFCHASIRDGIQLGNAKAYKFRHNSIEDLARKIQTLRAKSEYTNSEIYVSTESVFSMDGDSPDLKAMTSFCEEHKLHLVVDEAHAVGVFGKGIVDTFGLENKVFARMITFGKALGVHGAAVLGSAGLKDFLVNFCRSFIYTTALPPHTLATILGAYQFLDEERGKFLLDSLKENIRHFKRMVLENGLKGNFIESNSAIQVCRIKGNEVVKHYSNCLAENGFDVRPILSPTVPKGEERLRFCIHAFNTKGEIEKALGVLKNCVSNEE